MKESGIVGIEQEKINTEVARNTIAEVIHKRKEYWNRNHDIVLDKQFVESAAIHLLSNAEVRKYIRKCPWVLIEATFSIVDKDSRTVPFFLNEVQLEFLLNFIEKGGGRPYFILKGRQQGFTSLITALQLCYAIVRKNFSGFTIADTAKNTTAIFNDKAKFVYDMLPDVLKPHEKYNSKTEMFFDKLNSSWRVDTASTDIGRSKTLEFLHQSEVAFFNCSLSRLQEAIGQALTKNAVIIYETTANGYNDAKDLWDSGSCHNLFFEWWKTSEYRIDDLTVLDNLKDDWISTRVNWLKDYKGLSANQIAWYVQKYNSFLEKSSIRQEYPCTPEEAFISSGSCYFDKELVLSRLDDIREEKPLRRGNFTYRKYAVDIYSSKITDIQWEDDEYGAIVIYNEPQVKVLTHGDVEVKTVREANDNDLVAKKPYAIGGDTAGEGSDYYTAKVIDNITRRTVAAFRIKYIADDLYADQLYCLGKYYNDAIIGVETNFSRVPMIELDKLGYECLYQEEKLDALTNRLKPSLGFKTTKASKPIILSEFKRAFREDPLRECDPETLREMLTFLRNENNSGEAVQGKHDDMVMCTAIAHCVAGQGINMWAEKLSEESFLQKNFAGYAKKSSIEEEYIAW